MSDSGNGKTNTSTARATGQGPAIIPMACAPRKIRPPKRPNPPPSSSGRRFATLESFVAGYQNRLALASAEMVVRQMGQIHADAIFRTEQRGQNAFAGRHLDRRRKKLAQSIGRCIFPPSNSPAISSRPCGAADCPVSAANTAAWAC